MPINLLSNDTINKIAAGEVVERPLNAVKELVENSLDACASAITVEILEAGKKLIRVSDNGMGMDDKDLKLSVLRHATSKIENFNDLSHIQSLGFRGEALASIAAVSRFEIKTALRGASSGWKLSTEGGKDIDISPWAGAQGTISEVKDLFFNTPARLKFLKADATEKSRIIAAIEEVALANQEVSFKLLSENKTVFSSAQTDKRIERISDILGRDLAAKLKNIKIEHPKASFDIYFTDRDNSLSNRKYQFLFVNSRPVNLPKWLIHCVSNAYRESIPHDKFPGYLIYITIDPSDIDVNIHPTKREVKFADESGIYDIVLHGLKRALTSHEHPGIVITADTTTTQSPPPLATQVLPPQGGGNKEGERVPLYVREPKGKDVGFHNKYDFKDYAQVYAKQAEFAGDGAFDLNVKVLGQVFDTYIIAEKDGWLYIFDQHAVAERVRYEIYLSQIGKQALKLQQMLMPENFELSPSLSTLLKDNLDLFNELGIEVKEFGDNSFRVSAYPALLGNTAVENIVKTILDDLEIDKNIEIEKKREKIIRSACRASIKAGDNVSHIESKKLINDLFKCEHPFTCPHGRPTAYKISQNDLEKYFKRK